MLFIEETTKLNSKTFNEQTGYHILLEFGPREGYLKILSSDIKGGKFHDVEII